MTDLVRAEIISSFFLQPRSTFQANYGITVALAYCTTGVAYIFAIALQPAAAQLVRLTTRQGSGVLEI